MRLMRGPSRSVHSVREGRLTAWLLAALAGEACFYSVSTVAQAVNGGCDGTKVYFLDPHLVSLCLYLEDKVKGEGESVHGNRD